MDGGDDLVVVDPAQVAGRDRGVGMPELSLDHEQRDPLACHFHRMGVPELMRGETASDPGRRGGVMQLSANPGRAASAPAGGTAQDTEQSADR